MPPAALQEVATAAGVVLVLMLTLLIVRCVHVSGKEGNTDVIV